MENYLTKEGRKTLNEIKNAANIIIVKVDKDGKIVFMNRDECLKRIDEELNNDETYDQVRNPIIEMRTDIDEQTDGMYNKWNSPK